MDHSRRRLGSLLAAPVVVALVIGCAPSRHELPVVADLDGGRLPGDFRGSQLTATGTGASSSSGGS